MATAYFLRLIVEMNEAATDQEHIEVVLRSRPGIPDRTSFILGESSVSPLPDMIKTGRELAACGASVIAVPCVTAHYFQKELEEQTGLPVLNAINECAGILSDAGVKYVGILATDGTVRSRLFQQVFADSGIRCLLPGEESQREVMQMIYRDIKAGKRVDAGRFSEISGRMFSLGAEVVVLGCTELSLIKRDTRIGPGFLDAMDALARRAVLTCGMLRPEYETLITGC